MSGVYDAALEAFASGKIDWVAADAAAYLVRGYAADLAAHGSLADVPQEAQLSSCALEGKTNRRGYLGASDVAFASVPAGPYSGVVVAAGGRLVAYVDAPGTSLGGVVRVRWDERGIARI